MTHMHIIICYRRLLSPIVNPNIMAASETVSGIQGLSVELEVYVSGYPVPTESRIQWRYPDGSVILSVDEGVMFQDSGRRLVLSNVQFNQSGQYQCTVDGGVSASIQLTVYGECVVMKKFVLTRISKYLLTRGNKFIFYASLS